MLPRNMSCADILPASFRDPAGFLFVRDGLLLRQVNWCHKDDYDHLRQSRLYHELTERELLISHTERSLYASEPKQAYKIIEPERIPFISYPYEWCFSQIKAAALTTLDIQRRALTFGMSLKDCSAFNIQFRAERPVLIDTLSIEIYREGHPWPAYRQFCQHFLAPLALMSLADVRLNQLARAFIDGIPLDLASNLLPLRSRFKLPLLMHLHLHARAERIYRSTVHHKLGRRVSRTGLLGILDSLEAAVSGLTWRPRDKHWVDYYARTHYPAQSVAAKKSIVSGYLDRVAPATVWDIGANRGDFSRIAGAKGAYVVALDSDPATVEQNYLECSRLRGNVVLPLLIDVANPTPALGWAGIERSAFLDRGPVDTIMALAVVHHLVIAGGIPLGEIAALFARLCRSLIIEFVPKSDTQVQNMLANRADVFENYDRQGFLHAFGKYFQVVSEDRIHGTERTLFLMTPI